MENINIDHTDETPKVIFDRDQPLFELSGKSLPEDVSQFYNQLLEWLDAYAEDPLPDTVFDFKMDYFNTASSKMILDILLKLEEIHEEEKSKVLINWHYLEEDEDMEEAGEEYADMVEIPFNQIVIEE